MVIGMATSTLVACSKDKLVLACKYTSYIHVIKSLPCPLGCEPNKVPALTVGGAPNRVGFETGTFSVAPVCFDPNICCEPRLAAAPNMLLAGLASPEAAIEERHT